MALGRTVRRFFPSLRRCLDALGDFRDPRLVIYPARSLLWSGVLLFLFRLGARRRLRFELHSPAGVENLNRIAETSIEQIPHPDTLAYYLKGVCPEELSDVRTGMVRDLVRSRALDRDRLLGRYYTIAIDGTGHLAFDAPHCPHCLTQELANGRTRYYHPVLEAKLVCENGLSLSVATEFIQNTDGANKQDCELAAFYRLLPKLRKQFPMLRICLLLDGEYLNQNVMRLAKTLRLHWIMTFKEGSLPTAYAEFHALHALTTGQTLAHQHEDRSQHHRWLNGLRHEDQTFNAFECVETNARGDTTTFLWATDLPVKRSNVVELSQRGGRCRWKIENQGFNTQKNQGYNLEHAYCRDPVAAKNFYLLLQIAHILSQLIEKGNLLGAAVVKLYGSSRAFAQRLLEAFRNIPIRAEVWADLIARRFQIRLDTS